VKFRSVAVKLFIFTAFTGAVTIMLASVIGNFALFRQRYPVSAVFDDVTGLLNGDPVTLAGVTIGKVSGSHVEKGLAIVDLSIDKAVKLPKSSTIEIRYRNLIGLRVVNIDPGTGAAPYLSADDRVPVTQTQGPLDLDAVLNNLRPLLTGINTDDLNTLSKAILVSFAQHKGDIDAVLADTATFLNALAGKGVDLGNLVDNVASVATSAAGQRAQLAKLLSASATLTETLAGDSSQLDRTLVNLNTVTGQLGKLIADNRASLGKDIDNLVTLLQLVLHHQADLREIANHLDDQLAATLRGMTYGEWGNLYVPALCTTADPLVACNSASAAGAQPRPLSWLLDRAAGGPR